MVRVTVEVGSGPGGFRACVCAKSIAQAVRLAGDYYPGREIGVVFPLEPDFFVREPVSLTGSVEPVAPVGMVG